MAATWKRLAYYEELHAAVTLAASAEVLLGLSTQALSLDTQAANLIFAGPVSGAVAAPTFRAMVAADLGTTLSPTFDQITFTTLHTTAILADHIGEHVGAHTVVFDNTVTLPASTIVPDAGTIGLGSGKGLIQFDDETTDFISFSNCKVGIGTATPTVTLDVQGVISPREATKTCYGGIVSEVDSKIVNFGINEDSVNRFGGAYTSAVQGGLFRVETRAGSSLFGFFGRTAGSTAGISELMSILSSGNVGIGTTAPEAKLHIITTGASYDTDVNQFPGIKIQANTASDGSGISFVGKVSHSNIIGRDPATDDLIFKIDFGGAGETTEERVRIKGNGNVGIGMAPTVQFELSGSVGQKASGSTWSNPSDSRLKKDIKLADLDRCWEIVKNIPLKRYTLRDDVFSVNLAKDRSKLGWIAEDVRPLFAKATPVVPFILPTGEVIKDCLTLDVDQIFAAMYGALQKCMMQIEELQHKNKEGDL